MIGGSSDWTCEEYPVLFIWPTISHASELQEACLDDQALLLYTVARHGCMVSTDDLRRYRLVLHGARYDKGKVECAGRWSTKFEHRERPMQLTMHGRSGSSGCPTFLRRAKTTHLRIQTKAFRR